MSALTTIFLWRLAIDYWGRDNWRMPPQWHGRTGDERLGGLFASVGPFDFRWLPRESAQAEEPGDE